MKVSYPFPEQFVCTSSFGSRNSSESYVSSYHYGIDLVGQKNINVISCTNGTVKRASSDVGSGYGNHVWISNDDGSGCLYAHLRSYNVKVGQRITAKQVIGIMGNTGNSTGAHLHLGVSSNNDYQTTHANKKKYFVNPATWLGMNGNPKGKTFSGDGYVGGNSIGINSSNNSLQTINSLGGLTSILPSGEYYEIKDLNGTMSDWLYGRRYRVFVDLGNNTAFDISELRCKFEVIKTAFLEANQSILTIYNLNAEDENKLIKQGQRIIIEAGYNGEQYGIIFAGKVIQPLRSKENGVDYILTLVSMDSEVYSSYGLVGVSLVAQQSSRDAVIAATSKATYKQEVGFLTDSTIKYPRGKVMFGMPKTFLDNIARSENSTYYSDDGKVNIVSAKDVDKNSIMSFGPDSGLIGTPTQSEFGINCKVLLNPRITINSLFHIDNKKIENYRYTQGNPVRSLDQEGIYRVVKLTHKGDTRGNEWFTEIEAISQAGLLPGMMAGNNIYAW